MSDYLHYHWQNGLIQKTDIRFSNAKDRTVALQSFKNLIRTCEDFELKHNLPQDDKTLQKFLYARKFDLSESFLLLKNYYWYRKRHPEIFDNFNLDAEDIRLALENCVPGVLRQKDRKGKKKHIVLQKLIPKSQNKQEKNGFFCEILNLYLRCINHILS